MKIFFVSLSTKVSLDCLQSILQIILSQDESTQAYSQDFIFITFFHQSGKNISFQLAIFITISSHFSFEIS
jgi:hypothetical protein